MASCKRAPPNARACSRAAREMPRSHAAIFRLGGTRSRRQLLCSFAALPTKPSSLSLLLLESRLHLLFFGGVCALNFVPLLLVPIVPVHPLVLGLLPGEAITEVTLAAPQILDTHLAANVTLPPLLQDLRRWPA